MRKFFIGIVITTLLPCNFNRAIFATAANRVLIGTFTLPAKAIIPGAKNPKGLKYYSVNSRGTRAPVTASLQFPAGKPPKGGWPVIAWAHGTIGLNDNCAYSTNGPAEPARDWAYLRRWLSQGYAVVTSDYQGIGTPGEHAYLNGIMEAHNIVDAVKAAQEYSSKLSKKWAVVGQSQGGRAAIKTARYATQFENKKLNFKGGVGTGVPANLEYVLPLLFNPGGTANSNTNYHTIAYGLYILIELQTTYPQLGINKLTNNFGKKWLNIAKKQCVFQLVNTAEKAHIAMGQLLNKPLDSIPNITNILRTYLGLETSGYDRPIFVGQGLLDTDIFTPGTLKFIADLHLNHQPIDSHIYPQDDHNKTVNDSLKDSLPFVRNIFAK